MIRTLKLLLTGLVLSLAFVACEKEYSAENGGLPGSGTPTGTQSGTGQFTWTGAPGACVTPSISGVYQVGTALGISNTVAITVDVTTIGTYIITSGTSGGITFSAGGTFTFTGPQVIVFTGSGTPTAAGNFNFIPGTNGCSFLITVSPGALVTDCKACSYIPYCSGSSFTYVDTLGTGTSVSTTGITFVSDTTMDGKVFSKFSSTGGSTTFTYYNCTGGVTTVIAFNGADKITTTLLKANNAVGSSWTDVFTSGGIPTTYTWSIIAKGVPRTVLGVVYPDVIQVHLVGTVSVPPAPPVEFAQGDYFYARNVGLIENITYNSFTGMQESHRVIQSYFIP